VIVRPPSSSKLTLGAASAGSSGASKPERTMSGRLCDTYSEGYASMIELRHCRPVAKWNATCNRLLLSPPCSYDPMTGGILAGCSVLVEESIVILVVDQEAA